MVSVLPSALQTLLDYADASRWVKPPEFDNLLWDVLDDADITSGWFELLAAYLVHNNRLNWYTDNAVPPYYRPYFINGARRFHWQSWPENFRPLQIFHPRLTYIMGEYI